MVDRYEFQDGDKIILKGAYADGETYTLSSYDPVKGEGWLLNDEGAGYIYRYEDFEKAVIE